MSAVLVAGLLVVPLCARETANASALLAQADAAEVGLRFDVAAGHLYQLVIEHPDSPEAWAARSRLARILALTGDLQRAILQCQILRDEVQADHPLRQPIADLATTLARRLRATGAAPYATGPATLQPRGLPSSDEPTRIDVDARGTLLVSDAGLGRAFSVGLDAATPVPSAGDLSVAAFLPDGRTVTADKAGLTFAGGRVVRMTGTWGGKARQLKKTRAMAATSTGDLLVVDKDFDGLLRCHDDGACTPWGPPGKLRTIAVGASDFVFVVDDRQQVIRVIDASGRVVVTAGPMIGALRFVEILDIAVDRAYGVYVLDKETRRVDILVLQADRANKLALVPIGRVQVPSEGAVFLKSPSTVGVMPDGAVLVAGRSSPRLLRYQ